MLIAIASLATLAALGRRKGSEKVFIHPCGPAGGGGEPPGTSLVVWMLSYIIIAVI